VHRVAGRRWIHVINEGIPPELETPDSHIMKLGFSRPMNLSKCMFLRAVLGVATLAVTQNGYARELVHDDSLRLTPAAFIQLLVERNLEIRYARESAEVSRYISLSEDALYETKGLIGLRNEGISRQRTVEERKGVFGNFDPASPSVLNQRDRSAEVGLSRKLPSGAELAVSYRITRKNDNVTAIDNSTSKEFNTVLSLSVKQPLLRNAGRSVTETDRRVAEIEHQIQAIQFEQQIAKSAVDGLAQYWNAYREQAHMDLLHEAVAKTEESIADARARAVAGRSPAAVERDLLGVLLNRRAELMRGENSWREAQSQLATALNLDWDARANREILDIPTHSPNENLPTDNQDALGEWPLYRIALLKRQQAQVRLDYAANQMKPALDLVAGHSGTGYGSSAIDARNTAAETRFPTWYVGINMELPLNGNQRATQQFLAQSSRLTQADLEIEAVKRGFENDLNVKRESLRLSTISLRVAQEEVALRESILKNEQARLRLGSGQLSEVIRQYFELVDSRRRAIENRSRYEVAVANFQFVTGFLLSTYNVQIQGMSTFSRTGYSSPQASPTLSTSIPLAKPHAESLPTDAEAVADRASKQEGAQVTSQAESTRKQPTLAGNMDSVAPAVSADPPRFDYPDDGRRRVIQVGVFVENSQARSLRQRLLRNGIATLVNVATVQGERSIRIRVGPFTKAAELQSNIDEIKAMGLDARVLTY
jgi:outer membrane protein TolC